MELFTSKSKIFRKLKSQNGNPKKFLIFLEKRSFSLNIKKSIILSQKKAFLIFPKTEPCTFLPKLDK